ncbi:GNAT family N-acetyltransferase [Pseudomonas sp. NPDC087346]|uniref:GNAT family N-acetyltransferase n=1 Tax=Pseudomonas sp. NPDC087346 TaxID=3364438 RepID=UPI003821F7DF
MLAIRREQLQILRRLQFLAFAKTTIASLQVESPDILLGLSDSEISERIVLSLECLDTLDIKAERDVRSFIRLCFLVGPHFSLYPSIQEHLLGWDGSMDKVFALTRPDVWEQSMVNDIVSRYCASNKRPIKTASASKADIYVTQLRGAHAIDYHRLIVHPDVRRLLGREAGLSLNALREQIEADAVSSSNFRFAIMSTQHEFFGEIAFSGLGEQTQMSYWIRRDKWGRGAAKAALAIALADSATWRKNKITAKVHFLNCLSMRTLISAGFRKASCHAGDMHYFELMGALN